MIALLAYRPVRLKNLAMMRLGRHLVKVGGSWRIVFAAEETKTHVPYEAVLPSALAPRLERYLDVHRPVLLRGGQSARQSRRPADPSGTRRGLGVGSRNPARARSRWTTGSSTTPAGFGRGVSPHLFRDCAATSIAVDNPKHIGDASLVLGHAGHRTTEKHYNHARSLEASRRHAATLASLRESLEGRRESLKEFACAPSSTPATRPTSSGRLRSTIRSASARRGSRAKAGPSSRSIATRRSAARPRFGRGYQAMLEGVREAEFDVVVAEALDRLSRDQEDIAALFKRLQFAGIRLVTLGEGEIGVLHIGLKGTMNALFLKDLADKTRRGLRGRVEAGKSGGGNAYGYDVVRGYDPNGEPVRGGRTINAAEAEIVREIFTRYAAGEAPRKIAFDLNARRIPAPRGGAWSASTLNGNRARGTGILNNEMYIGRLVWNRLSYVKDPETGKRRSRANADDAVVAVEAPELAIVSRELWDAVKARQAGLDERTAAKKRESLGATPRLPFWSKRRPRYLFSGLMRCGVCGGGFSKISEAHFGCSTARNKGETVCGNRLTIRRDALEATVMDGLRSRLMDPALFKVFAQEFAAEWNRLQAEAGANMSPCPQRKGARLPADRSARRRSGRRRAGRTPDRTSSESSSDGASSSKASSRRPRRPRPGCIRTSPRSTAARSRNCTAP